MDYYIDFLKNFTSKERLKHSISTANFMKKYAFLLNIDSEKAFIAGLLHDIAREQDQKTILELSESFIKRNIIKILDYEVKKEMPALLHGVASAELMITMLNIKDIEILESACFHTLGGEKLSKLAKYTFVADYCEPLRKNRASKKVLKLITKEKNFNKAYLATYQYMLIYVIKNKKIVFNETLSGYNEAIKLELNI